MYSERANSITNQRLACADFAADRNEGQLSSEEPRTPSSSHVRCSRIQFKQQNRTILPNFVRFGLVYSVVNMIR